MKDKRSAESLEAIVNDYRGGIMRLLRSELPLLGEAELRFLVFVYAGFSSKAISIFMQDTVGNVYTKKSRLKSLILRSEAPHKQQFIDAMSKVEEQTERMDAFMEMTKDSFSTATGVSSTTDANGEVERIIDNTIIAESDIAMESDLKDIEELKRKIDSMI